jgi:hypothetical protein
MSILQRLRERREVIQELAKAGYFSEEDKEILIKLGLLGGEK